MTQIKHDSLKLTSDQAAEFRRRQPGVTHELCVYAMMKYQYFIEHGSKRPFLHDIQSRIVAPICPEVIQWMETVTGHKVVLFSGYWSRQAMRSRRRAMHGRKNYPAVIVERMGKKVTLQYPGRLPAIQINTNDQKNVVNTDEANEFNATNMAKTPVIWKISGGTLIALVFLDGAKKKSATVYHIKDGIASIARNGSCAQKYTQAELDQKGWQEDNLGHDRFAPILSLLTNTELKQPNTAAA